MSLGDRCLTRLIKGTILKKKKKTNYTKVRYALKIELKYGTVKGARHVVHKF